MCVQRAGKRSDGCAASWQVAGTTRGTWNVVLFCEGGGIFAGRGGLSVALPVPHEAAKKQLAIQQQVGFVEQMCFWGWRSDGCAASRRVAGTTSGGWRDFCCPGCCERMRAAAFEQVRLVYFSASVLRASIRDKEVSKTPLRWDGDLNSVLAFQQKKHRFKVKWKALLHFHPTPVQVRMESF